MSRTDSTRVAARLALTLIEAGLADPEDWEGVPEQFVTRTLGRWIAAEQPGMIDNKFGFRVAIQGVPGHTGDTWNQDGDENGEWEGGGEEEVPLARPERLFLRVDPGFNEHTGLEIGPAVARLEKVDKRLPALFWHRLSSIKRYVTVWDHNEKDELSYWENWDTWEEEHWHQENLDRVHSGGRSKRKRKPCIPASLTHTAVSHDEYREILRKRRIENGAESWEALLLHGALDLAEFVEAHGGHGFDAADLTERERQDAFGEMMVDIPSLCCYPRTGDALAHLWDVLGRDIWESGGPFDPACLWPFDGTTVEGVRAVHQRLRAFLGTMRRAARLVHLIEIADKPDREPTAALAALERAK